MSRLKAEIHRKIGDFELNVAIESLALGYAQDAVSLDLEHALGAISEVDGRAVCEDVVADIFAKFCVGK